MILLKYDNKTQNKQRVDWNLRKQAVKTQVKAMFDWWSAWNKVIISLVNSFILNLKKPVIWK